MKRLSFSLLTIITLSFISVFSCSIEEENSSVPSVQAPEPEDQVKQFTLTVTSAEGGTVSNEGGTYDIGTEIIITVTINEGYRFTGWEGNDSKDESLTITLNSNQTYQALFELIPINTLTVLTSEGGTVSTEGGEYQEGTEVEIIATSNEGYQFTGWEGNDSTSASITITLNSNQTYQALFELIPVYTLSVIALEGGTVSNEGGEYEEGTEVTITASPTEGYSFVRWEEVDISTSSLTITISSNISLTAIFNALPNASNSSNLTDESEGPVIWMNETIAFNKSDGSNPNLVENQDRIRDNIWITRGNSGGQIFNIALNSNANKIESPVGTEWAIGTLDEIDNLSFDYFRNAVSRPKNVVGKNLVLHLIEDNIYLTVKFISWSQGKRGGFSYERSTP